VIGSVSPSGGTPPYSVQFYLDNTANGPAVTSSPYTHDYGALFVGDHTIKAAVTDAHGWTSNSAVATVHITGPLGVAFNPTNGATFVFGQAISLDAAPGGGNAPYVATFFTNGFAVGSIASAPYATNLGLIPAGSYTSYVHVVDSSAPTHQQVDSPVSIFTVLPNPLLITLTRPTNGQSAVAGQPYTMSATASVTAPLTIATVEFFFDGVSAGVATNAPYSVTIPGQGTGTHTVYAVATDSIGRTSYSATNQATFVVDPLANDNFVNRFTLAGPFATTTGNNTGATIETGEPSSQGFTRWGATLWWKWVAPVSGTAVVDTFGSTFNTFLSVYTGTAVNALTLVGRNDNAPGQANVSQVSFTATQGTEYEIQVAGVSGFGGGTAFGSIQLTVQMPPSVTITSPTNNSLSVAGSNIVLNATASSPNGAVTEVDFYSAVPGGIFTRIAALTNAPYTFVFSNPPLGTNIFIALVTDVSGASAASASLNVLVANIGVTITAPSDGASFGHASPITVNAFGLLSSGTITNIDFFADGQKFGQDGTAPFSAVWTNVTSGSHRLVATGTDDAGNLWNSAPVYVAVGVPIVGSNSVWKYMDNGSDQGTAWIAPSFDDSTWASGPAPLGYGDSNGRQPLTTNSFGPDPNNKFITTYYRQAFVSPDPNSFSNLVLNIQRDDGAIVYLNGAELARFNMPSGPVGYTNVAAANANDDGGTTFTMNVNPSLLHLGTNEFAVEIHQDTNNSSDIWFVMELIGTPYIVRDLVSILSQPQSLTITPGDTATFSVNAVGAPPLYYQWLKDSNSIAGATNSTFSVPFASSSDEGTYSVIVSNANNIVFSSNAVLRVGYYPITITSQPQDQTVSEGASVLLSVGISGALPYHFQWFKDGNAIANATNQSLSLSGVTVADMATYFVVAGNRFSSAISSEVNVNVLSLTAPGVGLLGYTAGWRYDQSGTDLGTAWRDPAFNDSGWLAGNGVFYNTSATTPQPKGTLLSLTNSTGGAITSYYFRTHFTWNYSTTNAFLIASNLLDDGAVYYLNGVEAARLRLPAGTITANTLATAATSNGTNYDVLTFPNTTLRQGDNVLAVEVHQATIATNGDVVFGLALKATAKDDEVVRMGAGPASISVNEGQNASFTAEVFGTPPFTYQWLKNGNPIAGATNQTLILTGVHSSDQAGYSLVAANRFNSAQSSSAQLTVIRDLVPPAVLSAVANDANTVVVAFSEPLDPATASNPGNYSFSPGLSISGVQVLDSRMAVISTSTRDAFSSYTVTVSGVGDTAVPPNLVSPPITVPVTNRRQGVGGALAGVQTVFLIIFENQDWANIKGNTNCPYFNSLLPQASYCEQFYAHNNQHPSEPNYIYLEAGTNFGFTDDNGPSRDRLFSTNHLATQMRAAGIDWRGYMESMPVGAVGTNDAPEYVGRHNPFAFFNDVVSDYNYATNHIRPYSYFANDLAAGQVGRYNFITPNLTNDMHDTAPGSTSAPHQGDVWLSQELPRILASPAYTNNGAVILTFDESFGNSQNPIMMIVLSPLAKGGGYVSTNFYDHASTVRTVQDIFGLRPYLGGASTAQNLGELFHGPTLTVAWSNSAPGVIISDMIPGRTNYVQASSDLVHWTFINTNTASTPVYVPDPAANGGPRFYRLIQTP